MLQLTFSAICFEQVLSSEQVFIFFFLFFAVYFLKVQCSANLSCYAFHNESAVIISYCMCLCLQSFQK